MIGPKVKIQASCFNCEHCKTERYAVQSDSGTDVRCGAVDNKYIGDSRWDTPDWCPFLSAAVHALCKTKLVPPPVVEDLTGPSNVQDATRTHQCRVCKTWWATAQDEDDCCND
jgi:hypothetical protein